MAQSDERSQLQAPSNIDSKERDQQEITALDLIFQVENDVAEGVIQCTQRFRVMLLDCLSAPSEQIADFFGVVLAHSFLQERVGTFAQVFRRP